MQNLVHRCDRDYFLLSIMNLYMYAHTSDTGTCTQKHTDIQSITYKLMQLKMCSKHRLEMDEDSSMEWEPSIKKSIICVNMY